MDSPRRSQRVQALGKRTDTFSPSSSVLKRAKLKKLAAHHSPNDNGVGSENAALISPARKKRDRSSKTAEELAGAEIGTLENHGRKSLRSRNKSFQKRNEPRTLANHGSEVMVSKSVHVVENIELPTAPVQNDPLPSQNSSDTTGFRRSARAVQPSRKALESFAAFPVSSFVKRARQQIIPENTSSSLTPSSAETSSDQIISAPVENETGIRLRRKPKPDKARKITIPKGRKRDIASDKGDNPALSTTVETCDAQKSKKARNASKIAADVEMDSSGGPLRRSHRLTCRKAAALNSTASTSSEHVPDTLAAPPKEKTKRSASRRTKKTSKAKNDTVEFSVEDLDREALGLTTAVDDNVSNGQDADLVSPSSVSALEIMTQPEQAVYEFGHDPELSNDLVKKNRTPLIPDLRRKGSLPTLLRDSVSVDLDVSAAVPHHSRSISTPSLLTKKARSRSGLSMKSSDCSRYDELEALFMADASTSSAFKRAKRKDVDLDGVAEWFSTDEAPLDHAALISPIRVSYRPKNHFLLDTIDELAEITVIEPVAAETGGAEWQSTVEVLLISNVQSPPDLSRQVSEMSTVDEFASPDAERFHSPVLSEMSADSWHSATDIPGNDNPANLSAEVQIPAVEEQDPNVVTVLPVVRSSPRISPMRSPMSGVSEERSVHASPETPAPVIAQILFRSLSTGSENSIAPDSQSFPSTQDSQNETSMFTQQFEFLSSLPSLSQMSDPLAHSTPLPSASGSSSNKDTQAQNGSTSVSNLPSTSLSSDSTDNPIPNGLPLDGQVAVVEDIIERPVTPVENNRIEMERGVQTVSSPKRPYCLEPDLVSPIEEILQHKLTTDEFRVKLSNGDVAVVPRRKMKENVVYQQMMIDFYAKSYAFRGAGES